MEQEWLMYVDPPARKSLPRYPFREEEEDVWFFAVDDSWEAESTTDKACLDPELSDRCSPCFYFYRGAEEDAFKLDYDASSYRVQSSPTKHLLANVSSAEFLAKCTRRMQASDQTKGGPEFSTSFALAPTLVGCAKHATPEDPPTSVRASCRIVDAYPTVSSAFDAKDLHRADLKWGSSLPDTGPPMSDPISNVPWIAEGYVGETCTMDFEVLSIDNPKVPGQKRIHEFAHIMLPASVTYFGNTPTSLPCGVVGFPTVDGLFQKFANDEEADRVCRRYRYTVRRELANRMKDMFGKLDTNMDDETKSSLKPHASEQLRNIVRKLLEDCFGRLRTGDMMCSMGKLLDSNETMLAANYSTLPGSSGSAVFSPYFPVGTFIGIQAGAAAPMCTEKGILYPDHNVATSTDNPAFFISYFNDVVPKLHSPSAFEAEERSHAFRHYLLKHLKLIVQRNLQVTAGHEPWLKWAVQGDPPQPICRKLFPDAVQETSANVGPLLLRVSDQLLQFSLRCRGKGLHQLPATSEELAAALTDTTRRNMFFEGVKQEMEHHGVNIQAWGLPVKVHKVAMLLRLASEFVEQ